MSLKNALYVVLFLILVFSCLKMNSAYAGTCSFIYHSLGSHYKLVHFVTKCGLTKDRDLIIFYSDNSQQVLSEKTYGRFSNVVFDPHGDEIVK